MPSSTAGTARAAMVPAGGERRALQEEERKRRESIICWDFSLLVYTENWQSTDFLIFCLLEMLVLLSLLIFDYKVINNKLGNFLL